MKRRVERLEQAEGGTSPRPLAHLTDEQLARGLANLRAGRPSGVSILPPGVPTGFEDLSDKEIVARLEAAKARLAPGRRYRMEE